VLAAIGDVVDDIVVRLAEPIRAATDAAAAITRRRGGSAANVTAVAAHLTGSSRLLGQVGDDATGDVLLAELAREGVDAAFVRRAGRSGTIVVLVDTAGERTFLTDPGDARSLDRPEPSWLDGVEVLHVPFYSLVDEPMASTARTLARWAGERGIAVSVDTSSWAVLEAYGLRAARAAIAALRPAAVFANADEARVLGVDGALAGAVTFVKRGADPAVVHLRDGRCGEVPAVPLDDVGDTTGAGDAFAAGVLTRSGWLDDPIVAATAGHLAAAALLRGRARW
jgi:sugar/nucleoside kinase (ribokinase family)